MTKASYDGQSISDSLGRTIILRKPNIMDKFNLISLLDKISNVEACMNMMVCILYVARVNDRVYESPRTYEECLGLLQNLEEEGIQAVSEHIAKHIKKEPEDIKK